MKNKIKKDSKEAIRLQTERDYIKSLLKGTPLALVGWNSSDDFSAMDCYGNTFEIKGGLYDLLVRHRELTKGT